MGYIDLRSRIRCQRTNADIMAGDQQISISAYNPNCSLISVHYPLIAVLFILLLTTSCIRDNLQNEGLLIAVSIPPQAWFVRQIALNKAKAHILVPPGQNPHNYEPTPRQIQSLSSVDAWILSGSEFEIALRPKIESLFPDLLIIDGTHGVNFRLLEDHDHDTEFHYNETFPHSLDKHTWLGYEGAVILASHIKDTLCILDNENTVFYNQQYEILYTLINEEFNGLKTDLAPVYGKSVFVYHPSFGYFLDEFGIHQEAVETGGKEPTPRQLNNLIEKMKAEKPAAIFVQVQFPVNAARTIANSVGAQVIELDPLAENWLENIRFIGQVLKDGF